MKKRITLISCLCLMVLTALAGETSALLPARWMYGELDRVAHVLYPLEEMYIVFPRAIEILPGASGRVECEGKTVAVSTGADDPLNYSDSEGIINLRFEKTLLPKGKDYTLVLEASSVRAANDHSLVNGTVRIDFTVPANLGKGRWDIKETGRVEKASTIWIYWGYETEAKGNPVMTLSREGEKVADFPVHVGWDWNLGQAYVDFGKEMKFEDGVRYSLELAAGSVCSLYRDDIVNETETLDFIGSCVDTPEFPRMYLVGFNIDRENDVLESVVFRFDDLNVTFGEAPHAYLVNSETGEVVKEGDMRADIQSNCFSFIIEFNQKLESETGYTFSFSEGSFVWTGETPKFSPAFNTHFNSSTAGIETSLAEEAGVDAPLYDLFGRRVSRPVKGTVYLKAGRKIVF